MKKVFAICLALVMVLSLGINVMAAPNSFVNSPSNNRAPIIIEFENETDGCTAIITVIPFGDRDQLSDEKKQEIENAYNQIINTDKLTDMFSGLEGLISSGMIETDLAISDLFYLNMEDCDTHFDHGKFKIKLSADTLKGFLGLIQVVDGKWQMVPDASVDGEYLIFSIEDLSTLAVVVDRTKAESTSPITGDPTANYIFAAVMFAGLCLVMVAAASKKKA